MKVTSLDTSISFKPQIAMLVAVGVASVLSGIAPASRAMWFTEMFWAWGLAAILLLTYRRFRFSTAVIDGGKAGLTDADIARRPRRCTRKRRKHEYRN